MRNFKFNRTFFVCPILIKVTKLKCYKSVHIAKVDLEMILAINHTEISLECRNRHRLRTYRHCNKAGIVWRSNCVIVDKLDEGLKGIVITTIVPFLDPPRIFQKKIHYMNTPVFSIKNTIFFFHKKKSAPKRDEKIFLLQNFLTLWETKNFILIVFNVFFY